MGKLKELFINMRNDYLETIPELREKLLEEHIQKRYQEWEQGKHTPNNATINEWEKLGKPLKK